MTSHGKMSLTWLGDTLKIHISNPLNAEAINAFALQVHNEINKKGGGLWLKLVSYSPCALGGPDVVEITSKFDRWCFSNGCIACAVVISCAPQKMLHKNSQGNTQLFNNEEQAIHWLSSLPVILEKK